MGKRFSRCLGISKYSTVLDTEDAFGTDIYDENAIKAIAIELDENESQNPGLILSTNNEV